MNHARAPLLACLWRYPLAPRHAYGLACSAGFLGAVLFACAAFIAWPGRAALFEALFYNVPHASFWAALGLALSARHLWLWARPAARDDAQTIVGGAMPSGLRGLLLWVSLPGAIVWRANERLLQRFTQGIGSASSAGDSLLSQTKALPWMLGVALVTLDCVYAFLQVLCVIFTLEIVLTELIGMLASGPTPPKPGAISIPGEAVAATFAFWILAIAIHVPWRAWVQPLAPSANPHDRPLSRVKPTLVHGAKILARAASAPFRAAKAAGALAQQATERARERVLAEGRANGVYAEQERADLDQAVGPAPSNAPAKRL